MDEPPAGLDRERGVGDVLLDPHRAGAVLSDEDVSPAAVGALDGDVAWEHVEHALDHGQGLIRLRLECQEGRAEPCRVRTVHRCRWVRKQSMDLHKKNNNNNPSQQKPRIPELDFHGLRHLSEVFVKVSLRSENSKTGYERKMKNLI